MNIFNLLFFLVSFAVSFALFLIIIPLFRRHGIGQFIRPEGPIWHKNKEGTPTAGGIVFLILPLLFIPFVRSRIFVVLYLAMLLNGAIGILDDFLSVKQKESEGLSVRERLLLQLFVSVILYFLFKPFIQNYVSFGKYNIQLGTVGYFLFFLFVALGTVNAFNLTDGIDGLLASNSIVMVLFIIVGTMVLPILPKSELGAVNAILFVAIGSLTAYLWFNSPKAGIFMGDTGSLSLGGLVFAAAVIAKLEILLVFIAIIPVIEALSIFIQVSYFKATHGKRVFKMAPIHHHFEKCGWSEPKIVFRFAIITVVSSMLGILLFLLGRFR